MPLVLSWALASVALLSRLDTEHLCIDEGSAVDIDEKAPGNISQQGVGGKTDNETAHDSMPKLPEDEDAGLDEEMPDVEANNTVSSEHPDPV